MPNGHVSIPAYERDGLLVLQVGSTRFTVDASRFAKVSPQFAAIVKASRESYTKEIQRTQDGAIAIQGDPDTFRHIVEYFAHGLGPLFYIDNMGFDRGRYAALHALCAQLGVEKMAAWVQSGAYERAISVDQTFEYLPCQHVMSQGHRSTHGDKEEIIRGVHNNYVIISSKKTTVNYAALKIPE